MLGVSAFILIVAVTAGPVPELKICGRKNPNLDDCILNSIEALKDDLLVGIPEWDVPKLQEIVLEEPVHFLTDEDIKVTAEHLKFIGLKDHIVKKLHFDQAAKTLEFDIVLPNVDLIADYDIYAKIGVVVAGKGPIHINTKNLAVAALLKFQIVTKGDKELFYFTSMTTKLDIKDFTHTFKFETMDGENKVLADAVNAILKDQKKEIIDRMTPNLEAVVSQTVLETANKVVKHFTYNDILPDRE